MLRIPCFHPDPVCALSHSVVSNSSQPHGLYPSRPLRPWGLSRPKHWSGLPCPPSGDLSNPGIEPRFPHCSRILYLLSYQGFIQATRVQFPGRELTSRFALPLTASPRSQRCRQPSPICPWGGRKATLFFRPQSSESLLHPPVPLYCSLLESRRVTWTFMLNTKICEGTLL